MKCKAILLIAAMILTPMSMIISTTTVNTPQVFTSTGGTATLTPSAARANTKIQFSVIVTNSSTTDNIDNVEIVGPSGTYALASPTGRVPQMDGTLDNVIVGLDNIKENAVPWYTKAGENLLLAADNLVKAGISVKNIADNLALISYANLNAENVGANSSAKDNAAANFTNAAAELLLVQDAIDNTQENWAYIYTHLRLFDNYLVKASGIDGFSAGVWNPGTSGSNGENMDNINTTAARLIWQAGENIDNYLLAKETTLNIGDFENLGLALYRSGENLYAAGTACTGSSTLKTYIQNAGTNLQTFGLKLQDAAGFIDNAAYCIAVADNYVARAADNISGAAVTGSYPWSFKNAGDNLRLFENTMENAGANLPSINPYFCRSEPASTTEVCENIFKAGENMKKAASWLENVAFNFGVALGGDEENAAAINLMAAADNLGIGSLGSSHGVGGIGSTDLTTVGNQIKNMATNLSAGMVKAKATMQTLGPENWTMTEISVGASTGVRFDAQGDNIIAPGASKTFSFIWTTPNIATESNLVIGVLISKEEPTYTNYDNLGGFTVRVDGKKPVFNIVVTQTGVGVENVIGNTYENGTAVITITASEALNLAANPDENVRVENSGLAATYGRADNLLPPIAFNATNFTTTDNIVWTLTTPFTVGAWDDNVVRVRITKTEDSAGNEVVDDNSASVDNLESGRILVDTRAPVFFDNGLGAAAGLLLGMRTNVTQARLPNGALVIYRYVDNKNNDNLTITVCDNTYWRMADENAGIYVVNTNNDNDINVTAVTVDGVAATRDPTQENRWSLSLTLAEGFHSVVTVTATDRCGNSKTENAENIFIDTKEPTIAFNTITKGGAAVTWHENSFQVDDNMPTISLTVLDTGGISTGLGVQYENLGVYLSDNENVWSSAASHWYVKLENSAPFDPATGVFENTYENHVAGVAKGLQGGTYWIIVMAADNLSHGRNQPPITGGVDNLDNIIAKQSFVIDLTAPATADIAALAASTSNPLLNTSLASPHVQISTSVSLTGAGCEAGSTIKVYLNDSTTASTSTTVGTDGRWTVTITVTAGASTKIELTLTDTAGNESTRQLFGFVLADGTAPAVTISSPVTGASTDKASVTVTGTIGKDTWETYNSGTMRVAATTQVGSAIAGVLTIGSDGTFTVTAALSEGPNSVTITATDSAGNTDSSTITVERTVTPWATYAIVVVIIALILAAIAIFRKK